MEITKEQLYELYIIQNKTTTEISTLYGVCSATVSNYLKKYSIPTRERREAQRPIKIPYATLHNEYIVQLLSLKQMERIHNVSATTIERLLLECNIPIRKKTWKSGHNKGKPMSTNQKQKLSSIKKEQYKTGEIQHWNKGRHWSRETRNKISKTLLHGKTHSPRYYGDDWVKQRTSCLQRDDYHCQQCNTSNNLEVHHWEPYRFCFNNSLENLVTLCSECHAEIHQLYKREGFIAEAERDFYAKPIYTKEI